MLKLPYQKLQIWQKGFALARLTYDITRSFPEEERYGLISQMRRSAVSVPSNIAEGSQRTTNRDFHSFIAIAKGSLAELETQVLLSQHLGYMNETNTTSLIRRIEEIAKMLRAFALKLTTTH